MTTAEIAEEVQAKRNKVVDKVVSGEYKDTKYSDRDSESEETQAKITSDMTEEERYEVLKKRSINNIPLATGLASDVLEKIKMTEVWKQGNTEDGVTQNSRSVNISIAQIFAKINPSDKSFLKYIPDVFLNSKQKTAKQEAFGEDVLCSDRDTDAVSNRTLLANALESVAQNDIEK